MDPTGFRLTRESTLRIDRDGHVWHDGERVLRSALERLLLSWVARDAETGRWILRNATDWCFVTVDDAPLAVRAVHAEGPGFVLTLSDGSSAPLDPATLRLSDDGVPYCDVRGLPARFDRHAAFGLLEHCTLDEGTSFLLAGGHRHRIPVCRAPVAPPESGSRLPTLAFYTRPGCCLCEDALDVVNAEGPGTRFELRIVDVDTDPALRARYGSRIPVIEIGGRFVAEYRITREALRAALGSSEPPR